MRVAGAAVVGLALAVSIALSIVLIRDQSKMQAQLAELRRLVEQTAASPDNSACRWAAITSAVGGGVSLDQTRRMLREELGAAGDGKGRDPEAVPLKTHDSPESLAALAEANQIVTDAIAGGVWGQAQDDALARVKKQLSPEQLMTLTRVLAPAVNSQQLRVQINGPIF